MSTKGLRAGENSHLMALGAASRRAVSTAGR
jgi:hypothetical protein